MTESTSSLTPVEVARLLEATGVTIQAELTALPEHLAAWHPAPGEWCVKEALGHIIEAERRGFAGRIRTILEGDEPRLPGWDQVAVARERRDCERPTADLLAEFSQLRKASVALVNGLSAADLQRGGHHETVGYLKVSDLLHEWLHHDRNHVRQMFANLQTYVWPNMGNAQKFSSE